MKLLTHALELECVSHRHSAPPSLCFPSPTALPPPPFPHRLLPSRPTDPSFRPLHWRSTLRNPDDGNDGGSFQGLVILLIQPLPRVPDDGDGGYDRERSATAAPRVLATQQQRQRRRRAVRSLDDATGLRQGALRSSYVLTLDSDNGCDGDGCTPPICAPLMTMTTAIATETPVNDYKSRDNVWSRAQVRP
ncbi:hypothetical protein EDB85DRAFT_80426 [Lactarius pseudohatsudake]|nr:hypothetical protein EDB85DRAFT_80426 [Lactarius pseudohatsudake]